MRIDAAALDAIAGAHALTARLAAGDAPAYGINTGFGLLAQTRIPPAQRTLLQRNIILSHSSGCRPAAGRCDRAPDAGAEALRASRRVSPASAIELARFLERLINARVC